MWRQRLRWLKGGHLFLIGPDSVFFKKQKHMSFYQKSMYWLSPVAHFLQFFGEPVIITLPFFCLVLTICPYGLDSLIFYSHVIYIAMVTIFSVYHTDPRLMSVALRVKSGYRILWFTSFKAVVNTLMVVTGFKPRGHFKITPKTTLAGEDKQVTGDTAGLGSADSSAPEKTAADASVAKGSGEAVATRVGGDAAPQKRIKMHRVHTALSQVTETRRLCMPLDGTLDVWVLMFFLGLSLFSAAIGFKRMVERNALYKWSNDADGLVWLGIVFALVDCVPGLLIAGCATLARALRAALPVHAVLPVHMCVWFFTVSQERVAALVLRRITNTGYRETEEKAR
jgi:hypothetical protein